MVVGICYFIIYLVEALIFYYYCNNIFTKKLTTRQTIIIITTCYILEFASSFLHKVSINTLSFILFNYLIIILVFDCKALNALFHTFILTAAMSGTELLIAPIFTDNFWADQSLPYNLIIQAPLCKLAYFIVINLIIHLLKGIRSENSYTSIANYVLIIIAILTYAILYSMLNLFDQSEINTMQRISIITNAVFILIINLLASWVYRFTLSKSEENTQLEIQLVREQDYSRYYQALLKEDEHHHILIHDIKKHLHSIMMLNEDHNNSSISSYISNLLSDYELLAPVKISDNKLLNSICNRYHSICKEKNIAFHTDIRKNCFSNFPENELTAIICNLLDNAIEAASDMPYAFVEINIYKRTDYTYINVINSCKTNPIDLKTGKLISHKKFSSKSGHIHGIGLRSVELIAKRYQGIIEYHYDEDTSEFHIIVSVKEE